MWRTRTATYKEAIVYENYSDWSEMTLGTSWTVPYDGARWFEATVTIPESYAGKRVVLELDLGGEGVVSINGQIKSSLAHFKAAGDVQLAVCLLTQEDIAAVQAVGLAAKDRTALDVDAGIIPEGNNVAAAACNANGIGIIYTGFCIGHLGNGVGQCLTAGDLTAIHIEHSLTVHENTAAGDHTVIQVDLRSAKPLPCYRVGVTEFYILHYLSVMVIGPSRSYPYYEDRGRFVCLRPIDR